MNPTRRHLLWAAALAPVAAACSSEPPRAAFPQLTFGHLPPLLFVAAAVDVADDFRPPAGPPHIESALPVSPAFAMARWAADRVRANGQGGQRVRVVIEDASATQTPLPRETGIAARFTNQQALRYDVAMAATVTVRDVSGRQLGYAAGSARRSTSIAEDASLNQRDTTLFKLVEQTVQEFDREMDRNIRQFLGGYLA